MELKKENRMRSKRFEMRNMRTIIAAVLALLFLLSYSAHSVAASGNSDTSTILGIVATLSQNGLKLSTNYNVGSFSSRLICGCLSQGENACPGWLKGTINVMCVDPGNSLPGYRVVEQALQNPANSACYLAMGSYKSSLGIDFSPFDTNGFNVTFDTSPAFAYIEAARILTDHNDYEYYFNFHFKPNGTYSSDKVHFLLRTGDNYVDASTGSGFEGNIFRIVPKKDGAFTYTKSIRTKSAITEACMKFDTLPKGLTTKQLCVRVATVTT